MNAESLVVRSSLTPYKFTFLKYQHLKMAFSCLSETRLLFYCDIADIQIENL